MKKFLAGLVAGLVLCPLLFLTYFVLGMAPAATNAPPMPLERFIAGAALSSRISRESPSREPVSFGTADLVNGASIYKSHCGLCHGSYQQRESLLGKAMYPPAPQLFTAKESTEQPIGVIYWELQNGIRLSGMPSFESILNETEKWNVSALLTHANSLPAEAEEALQSTPDSAADTPHAKKKEIEGRE